MIGNTDARIICKEHNKLAFYCESEKRWICPKCEPESMGKFRG